MKRGLEIFSLWALIMAVLYIAGWAIISFINLELATFLPFNDTLAGDFIRISLVYVGILSGMAAWVITGNEHKQ